VSDTDSFIDEVSEEVRRDRLFKLMKRYGWIGIALVLLLVGGAAFNEWRQATARTAAENLGDQLLSALKNDASSDRIAALNDVNVSGDAAAMVALLKSAEALSSDAPDEATAQLKSIATDETAPVVYRHLAELKLILIEGDSISPQDRIARLEALTTAGAPYRLLATEQIAVAEIEMGESDKALDRLAEILADGEVTAGLRRRVSQLIVALGGELDAI